MMDNILGSGQSETVAEFAERVKNGTAKTTSYRNYYATLQPVNRLAGKRVDSLLTIRVRGEKRLSEKERLAILMELL